MSDGPSSTLSQGVSVEERGDSRPWDPVEAAALQLAEEINRRSVVANKDIDVSAATTNTHNDEARRDAENNDKDALKADKPQRPGQLQFRTTTVAPSPDSEPVADSSEDFNTSGDNTGSNISTQGTDLPLSPLARVDSLGVSYNRIGGISLQHKGSSSSLKPISRTPSIKQAFAQGIGSACSSAVPSPIISAMGDITPLPSPLMSSGSPNPWRRLSAARPPSRDLALPTIMPDSVLITSTGESVGSVLVNQSKRKTYTGLKGVEGPAEKPENGEQQTHGRNRSISEYIPETSAIPKRQTTVSGSHLRPETIVTSSNTSQMRREPQLSAARGLTPTVTKPPTPPPSESSLPSRRPDVEYFEAYGRHDQKLRRWRSLKKLGEGTFSRVMLATSQTNIPENESGDPSDQSQQPGLKTLVAVKVCEHGPRGGASEQRIEMSLKRELDIMKQIHHPSIVHLKAWNVETTRVLLVLSYCPGGDLFDIANQDREVLTPRLLRRVMSELVGAVQFLHERHIVHRDIKLENVLVNIPPKELGNPSIDWVTYPDSVITLTDLGLSRFVADDEKLETRCGSDDYAAPEVILGQPYDGKAIDAWSMGVLLYALLESRLPFDPPPGASDAVRMRSRTSHRIARIDWSWVEYAGDDGDHEADVAKFEAKGLKGAMEITEGFLKRARSRWPLDKVASMEWITGGIQVEGGVKFKEEEEGEVVGS